MENAKCPVCGWEITEKGFEVKVKDKILVVCCEECAQELKTPAKKTAGGS
jgi:ribosome-binding protein aMBF1 (putative translation factor)